MAEATASGTSVATGVFSRKSSGLIRVGGTLDVFIFNVGLVSVGIAIAYNQYYGPSLYPGAQPWISTLFAVAGMLFVAAAFYCWSVSSAVRRGVRLVADDQPRRGVRDVLLSRRSSCCTTGAGGHSIVRSACPRFRRGGHGRA
jgi:hypothetical protein